MNYLRKTAIVLVGVCILNTTAYGATAIGSSAIQPVVAEQAIKDLNVQDALKLAIEASQEIKTQKDSIIGYEEERQQIYDSFWSGVIGASAVLSMEDKVAANQVNSEQAQKDLDTIKQKLELSVVKAFIDIFNAEDALVQFDKSYAVDEKNFKVTEVKKDLGMLSEKEFADAKADLEKTKNSRVTNVETIDNAYRTLNRLLGAPVDKKYNLILDAQYKKLGEFDLATYVMLCKENDKTIRLKKASIKTKEYQIETYDERNVREGTGEISSTAATYESYQRAAQQLYRDLQEREKTIEDSVTASYNSILALERDYDKNVADLEGMRKELEIKKVQYELGKITKLELDTYQFSIDKLENTMRSQVLSHYSKVMEFTNMNLVV